MIAVNARLDLAPKDAVQYFAGKGMLLSWDHTETLGEVNAHSFTVAKATSLDLLRTIRGEVAKAIGPGQNFEQFKKTLRPRLQDMGWWGKKEVLDIDTGEITQAQLGSDRRLRTIYQANVQSAYMAGRYKRYADNAKARPYWRYIAIVDGRTRPAHAALHGKVWRWDDPIWKVLWPPNGWGCRCRVVALTEAEFKALGQPLEDGSDAIVELEVPINRDGDMATVQGIRYTDEQGKARVFRPDPGWDYNPGEAWARFDKNGDKPDSDWNGPDISTNGDTISISIGQKSWADYGRPALSSVPAGSRLPTPEIVERALDRSAATEVLAKAVGVSKESPLRVVKTPAGDVALRYEWLAHIVEKDNDARERWANFLLPTLESPFEVWLTEYKDGLRQRYIGLFEEEGILVVARVNKDGTLFWNMMKAKDAYMNGQRKGLLVFGK